MHSVLIWHDDRIEHAARRYSINQTFFLIKRESLALPAEKCRLLCEWEKKPCSNKEKWRGVKRKHLSFFLGEYEIKVCFVAKHTHTLRSFLSLDGAKTRE
jgi:hypothetical protein